MSKGFAIEFSVETPYIADGPIYPEARTRMFRVLVSGFGRTWRAGMSSGSGSMGTR
jgi:hypothetical protein